jgi:hypothetical protein
MQWHVCTNTYLTLDLILFIKNYYFTKFPYTHKCLTKSNSLFKNIQKFMVLQKARKILDQILADKPEEPLEENPLEKESQIAEPESLPNPPQPSAIPISETPEKEETLLSDFKLDFEDELFTKYGNTSNYYSVRKP